MGLSQAHHLARIDLVLPAAGWGEKEGTFINSERRIGVSRQVATAPGIALSDFRIFRVLAEATGCGEMFDRWTSPEAVFQIIKGATRDQPCDLTGHQFELLSVLARRPGRVLSRDQIMDALKGHPLEAFDRSIDVHISRIRAVIEDDPKSPRRVLTVRGAGYVFAKKQEPDA